MSAAESACQGRRPPGPGAAGCPGQGPRGCPGQGPRGWPRRLRRWVARRRAWTGSPRRTSFPAQGGSQQHTWRTQGPVASSTTGHERTGNPPRARARRRAGHAAPSSAGPLVPFPPRPSRSRAVDMTHPRTLVEKIWDDHVVAQDDGAPAVLAIDLHLVHEVTSPQAFTGLRARGAAGPPPGPDRRHRGPLHADHAARPAHRRPAWRRPRSGSSRPTARTSGSRSTPTAATPRGSSTSSARSWA